ncbi:MAG TPA: hypothetical protein VJI33_03520 [Candidatus Paceibacterota bacterium]
MSFFHHTNFLNDILLIAVGLVGGLGALMMIYQSSILVFNNFSVENYQDIGFKKSQILAMVQSKDLLTLPEKKAIINEIVGDKAKMYEFSDDELDKILEALNKN